MKTNIEKGTICVWINSHWVSIFYTPFVTALKSQELRKHIPFMNKGELRVYNHHTFKVQQ